VTKRTSPKPAGLFANRRNLIVVVLASAIVARIVTIILASDSFVWYGIWSDAATYNQWARRIVANGDWLGTEPFFMSPLYAYFLATIYTLFGESLTAVRVIQAAAGVGTALLVFLCGEKLFSRQTGFIAGILAAVYGPFLLSNILLLVETVKVFFLILTFWFLLTAGERNGRWWWFGAGCGLGCAVLCRPTDLLLVPVIATWILLVLKKERSVHVSQVIAIAAGLILIVAPVTVRNYMVSGEFIPVTSNGGLNFFLGNNPDGAGVYANVARLDLANDPDGRVYLEAQTGRTLSHSEVSSIWMERASDFIAKEPFSFLSLLAKKLLLFFHYKEIGQLGYNYVFVREYAIPILSFAPAFLVVGPLGILGVVCSLKRRKTLLLLYGFLAAEILSVVLFFVTDRFRLSSIPFLMIFAGYGLVELYGVLGRRETRTLGMYGLILCLAVTAMTVLNVEIHDEFSLEWEYVGLLHFNAKNNRAALQAFQQAGRSKDSFHLRNNIGNVYVAQGQTEAAIEQFRIAHSMDSSQAISMFSMGTAYASRQDWLPALHAFERSISINPRFAPAYLNKGLVLYYLQRFREALEAMRRYVELEQDKSKLTSVYGDIRNLEQLVKTQETTGRSNQSEQ